MNFSQKKHWAKLLPFFTICSFLSIAVSAETIITRIGIESDVSQTEVPITFGQIFKAGDVPAGKTLQGKLANGSNIDLQVDPKATHADGSLRHAIISLQLDQLTTPQTLALSLAPTVVNTIIPPGPASIIGVNHNPGFDARVEITLDNDNDTYTASPVSRLLSDNDQAYRTWLNGSLVSEWSVVVPLTSSSGNQHPHLMARFNIRAYHESGKVRVSTVIENNWTFKSAPSNLIYAVNIKIAGQSVFQQTNLTHYHHARWRKVFWFGGTEPDLHIRHDTRYMIASKVVPNYNPQLSVPELSLTEMTSVWENNKQLMDIGLAFYAMNASGAHPDIGPLPRWTVRYLVSMDKRAKQAALGTGVQAGSWSIHYRDQLTDLPVSIVDHPNLTTHPNHLRSGLGSDLQDDLEDYYGITEEEFFAAGVRIAEHGLISEAEEQSTPLPDLAFNANEAGGIEPVAHCVGNCTLPYRADTAHQPSLSFIPYIVTGDYYHLEELQFWANANMFRTSPSYRGYAQGWFDGWQQVRGQAWSLRTLGHAAYITPDSHPMKQYFIDRMQNNLDRYNRLYTNNSSANPLGFLDDPYIAKNNGRGIAPWMDDFFTWTTGYLVGLDFADALPLFEWKAKFQLGRMTTPDFCWVYSALYTLNVRASRNDPYYTHFRDLYTSNVPASVAAVSSCGSQAMIDANNAFIDDPNNNGKLDPDTPFNQNRRLSRAGEIGGFSESATGFPSNLQPALAIAAELGVEGASEAWFLFDNRSVKPDYDSRINRGYFNWDIVPPTTLDLTIGSNQWNMLSLPCAPAADANTVADILADDFSGLNGFGWAVYRYTEENGYTLLDKADTLQQGEGYWVIQVNHDERPVTIDVPSSCSTTPTNLPNACDSVKGCFDIPLNSTAGNTAWNLLGYPFTEKLSWNQLRVVDNDSCTGGCNPTVADAATIFHDQGWHYNPSLGTYEPLKLKELGIWQGFWGATLDNANGKSPHLLLPVN